MVQEKLDWFRMVVDQLARDHYGVIYETDAGAIADLPYTKERGYGYTGEPGSSWLIRWAWSEIFHPTASNIRAADIKPFGYRFDQLDPKGQYRLGLVLWAYQDAAARDLVVAWKGGSKTLSIPRFSQADGPRLEWIDLPLGAVAPDGTLELQFRRAETGAAEHADQLFAGGGEPVEPELEFGHARFAADRTGNFFVRAHRSEMVKFYLDGKPLLL
ncbi:hypothetical protein SDC9_172801 [bioreactor metagenome]|uniref:Uncharacterized protein n=1 Tax=bioreactor metagenome TaxID=1076179 RepID=A0A645GHD5_9ZZZZ